MSKKCFHPSLDANFKRRQPGAANPGSAKVATLRKALVAPAKPAKPVPRPLVARQPPATATKASSLPPPSAAAVAAAPQPVISVAEEAKAEARARGRARGRRQLGARPAAGSIAALRKPAASVLWKKPERGGATRPSLSEQLASIGAAAGSITAGIREDFGLPSTEKALKTTPARCFTVGKLTARYPSPVQFYADRCTYTFHHPYEAREIDMSMFYVDMRAISLHGPTLSFKIAHHLVHFSDDYDPARDALTIELSSSADAAWVQQVVLPKSRATASAFRVTSCGTSRKSGGHR